VIRRDSLFITPAVNDKRAALHVHSGWFDFENTETRMLTNVNIDVSESDTAARNAGFRALTIILARFGKKTKKPKK
jgi:hypothetical protein